MLAGHDSVEAPLSLELLREHFQPITLPLPLYEHHSLKGLFRKRLISGACLALQRKVSRKPF